MRMMAVKLKLQTRLVFLLVIALGVYSCAPPVAGLPDATRTPSTSGEIPTWTPRPQDLSALPSATGPAPVSETQSALPTVTYTPFTTPTPRTVTISISGGNLNVRRGPSLYYNYVGVFYDGETALAVGRDRISRWILIEIPSKPGARGWVTTETQYTKIEGDLGNLPFLEVEPASPAFIRNCTTHKMLVMPVEVTLLTRFNEPYNEEQFGVGLYQVYDLENPDAAPVLEVSLSEGKRVDIIYDWTGEKTKCE